MIVATIKKSRIGQSHDKPIPQSPNEIFLIGKSGAIATHFQTYAESGIRGEDGELVTHPLTPGMIENEIPWAMDAPMHFPGHSVYPTIEEMLNESGIATGFATPFLRMQSTPEMGIRTTHYHDRDRYIWELELMKVNITPGLPPSPVKIVTFRCLHDFE